MKKVCETNMCLLNLHASYHAHCTPSIQAKLTMSELMLLWGAQLEAWHMVSDNTNDACTLADWLCGVSAAARAQKWCGGMVHEDP